MTPVGPFYGSSFGLDDTALTIAFADGSIGTVLYAAGGDASSPKERLEVFGDGKTAVLDDFRSLELSQNGRQAVMRVKPPGDKGHRAEWSTFVDAIHNGKPSPIPFEAAAATSLATFQAIASLRSGKVEEVDWQSLMMAPGSVIA